jgi:uncharacterized OB-fold protein
MNARIVDGTLPRMIPDLTDENRAFWTGGAQGELLIHRCGECGRWVEPSGASCAACGGSLSPQPVSGRGTVFAFTVNHQAWSPDVPVPYVVALVQLEEQEDLRVPTNIVGCEPEAVATGMAVQVLFERNGDAFVPLFEPAREERS